MGNPRACGQRLFVVHMSEVVHRDAGASNDGYASLVVVAYKPFGERNTGHLTAFLWFAIVNCCGRSYDALVAV